MKPKLYRHFDADDNLLYVGVSISILNRIRGHRSNSHWFDRIAKITIQNFNTKEEMYEAEKYAILNEKPLCNVQFSDRLKMRDGYLNIQDLAVYLDIPPGRIRMEIQLKRFLIKFDKIKPYLWLKENVDEQMKHPDILTYVKALCHG